jgi:hypothetical protein
VTRWRGLALVTALIAAQPAISGQPEPADASADEAVETATSRTSPSRQEIVVTGQRRLDKETVRDAVRGIARRGRSAAEPLARYHDPLCVSVVGFGEALGERIAERVRMRARLVGVEVAEAGCAPNATLVMVDKPEVLIDRMRRERPGLLDSDSLRRIRAILREGYPAISWTTTERRDQFGRHLPPGNPLSGYERDSLWNEMMAARDNRFPSQINIDFSIARSGAVVVFDAYKMDGVHLDQLSDYAAMRILGDPRPGAHSLADQPETILKLFQSGPDAAPAGLTLVDLAYLKGLYAMSPTEPGKRLESFALAAYEQLVDPDDDEPE